MVIEIVVDIRAAPVALNGSCVRCLQEVLTGIVRIGRSLFQHQNIRHNLGAGIALKGSIRKSDSTQQVCSLHDVATHCAVTAVHGIAGCDKHHNTAGSYLIQALGKEIVVNCAGYLLRIALVRNSVVAKGNVADCHIHEVIRDIGFLKALDAYICVGIKVLGNQTGNAVQFHHGPAAHTCCHICRHSTHEVTHTGRRFHHSAAGKAQLLQTIIHGLDHGNIGVVSVQGRASGAGIFLIGQQFLQLLEFFGPFCLTLVEGICKAAPTHILGQDHLLRFRSISALCLQLLHQSDGLHIGLISGLFAIR